MRLRGGHGESVGTLLAFLAAAFAAYLPALRGRWVYDDIPLILQQGCFRSIGRIPAMLAVWQRGPCNQRPMRYVTYALDHAVFGLDPAGWHAVNVFLHGVVCWMLYRLLARLGRSRVAAGVAAGLLCLHPVCTEAVAYVSGRRDLLAALFAIACVSAYVSATSRRSALHAAGSVAAFLAAALSYDGAVALPALLLLVELRALAADGTARRGFFRRPGWWVIGPMLALGLAYAAFRVLAFSPSGKHALWGGSVGAHVATVLRVHLQYLRQLALPLWLQADYGEGAFRVSSTLLEPAALLGLSVVGGAIGLGLWLLRRGSWAGVGLLGYFALLVPSSHLVVHHELAAEHRLYVPAMALFALAGEGVHRLVARRRLLWLPAAALGVALLVLTLRRDRAWTSEEALWRATLEVAPRSARALGNLGVLAAERHDGAEAERMFRAAVEVRPDCVNLRNWGRALRAEGRAAEAAGVLERALRCQPHASAWLELGLARRALADHAGAEAAVAEAVRIDPGYFDALVVWGELAPSTRDQRARWEQVLEKKVGRPEARARLRRMLEELDPGIELKE